MDNDGQDIDEPMEEDHDENNEGTGQEFDEEPNEEQDEEEPSEDQEEELLLDSLPGDLHERQKFKVHLFRFELVKETFSILNIN